MQQALFQRKKALGEKMSSNIDNAQTLIPKAELAKPMLDRIAEMQKSELANTPNGKAAIEELISQVKDPSRVCLKMFPLRRPFSYKINSASLVIYRT